MILVQFCLMPEPSKHHHNMHKSNNDVPNVNDATLSTKVNSFPSTICEQIDEGPLEMDQVNCVSTPLLWGRAPSATPELPTACSRLPGTPGEGPVWGGGAGPPMLPHQGQGEPADSHREAACPRAWPFQRELERHREREREKEGWKDRRRRGCGLALPAGSHANFS